MAIVLKTDDQIENIKLEQNKDILKAYKNALYDDVLSNLSEQISHITASSWQSIRELNKKIEQAINNFKPEQASYLEMLEQYRLKGTQVLDNTDESLYITISKDKKIIVYIVSTIYLNLAKQALNNNDFGISLHFHKKHVELNAVYKYSNGYTWQEIVDMKPASRTKYAQTDKDKLIPVARKIWEADVSNILLPAHVANLAMRLTGVKRTTDTVKKWFKEADNLIPPAIQEQIDNESYKRGKDIDRDREKIISTIYEMLKDNCNQV